MFHPQSSTFKPNQSPKTDRRDDYVYAEKAADRIRKQLLEEESEVEAMLEQERDKKQIWNEGADEAKDQIKSLWFHDDYPAKFALGE